MILRILALFALRPGEVTRSLLTFGYLFLIIASYVILKAVRGALFISQFGAKNLPYVMIGIAVLAGIFVAAYIRLTRRRPTPQVVLWSLLFFASNVLLFWWLAIREFVWLSSILYLWAGVYGVLGTTQVWTMASELFTTREAKRVFGVVGAGGILGGTAGGGLTLLLAPRVGTPNMLLVVVAMLLLAAALVRVMTRHRNVSRPVAAGREPPRNVRQSLQLIRGSSHLRLLAGLIFITAMATTSVDFQYSMVADEAIDETDSLAAFFGGVFSGISILSFLVQIVLTSRLLGSVGVGISILILPLSMAGGTAALFMSGALWAAVFLKGSDGALKHSLDRSCRELMYLPVPSAIRAQAKSTIDTVMDRLGDGAAGVLQLLVITALSLSLRASLAINFLLFAIWILLALRLRAAYVNQLFQALGRRRRRAEELPVEGEADTRRALEAMLRSGSDAEKSAVLEWVARNRFPLQEKLLFELARETDSTAVRNAALGLILAGDDGELPPDLLAELEKEGQNVLVAAIDLLVEPEEHRVRERLEALLDRAGETTRLSVVAFMLRRLGSEFEPFAQRVFEALLAPESPPDAHAAAVRALALLPADSALRGRVDSALSHPQPAVAAAAVETVARMQRADLIPRLVGLLDRPELRHSVRQSLALFGGRAVPTLVSTLDETSAPPAVRRRVPRVLGEIATPRAIDSLISALDDADRLVRDGALRALRGVRRDSPEIKPLQGVRLQARLFDQVESYETLLAVEDALRDDPDAAGDGLAWLVDALESERFRILGRIFALLALEYPLDDMTRSWFAVRGGTPRERANAVELLDNTLPKRLKSRLLGLLEPSGHRVARSFRGRHETLPRKEALRRLIEGANPWIAACALFAARRTGEGELDEAARRAAVSEHDVLREEAVAYLATVVQGETR